jgi:hypothetical protein
MRNEPQLEPITFPFPLSLLFLSYFPPFFGEKGLPLNAKVGIVIMDSFHKRRDDGDDDDCLYSHHPIGAVLVASSSLLASQGGLMVDQCCQSPVTQCAYMLWFPF